MNGVRIIAALLACLILPARAADDSCFLHDGDVWVFHGDSITHADTYRRLCERVFRHYHPDAKVEFLQAAVWGSTSSDVVKRLKAEGRKATVVSMMLGMNNAINGGWVKGQPREPYLDAYPSPPLTAPGAAEPLGPAHLGQILAARLLCGKAVLEVEKRLTIVLHAPILPL